MCVCVCAYPVQMASSGWFSLDSITAAAADVSEDVLKVTFIIKLLNSYLNYFIS